MNLEPMEKRYPERIGDREFQLVEAKLDVFDEVTLWSDNPRLIPYLPDGEIQGEDQLEFYLQQTNGYDVLRRSIADVGQMDPIYVLKRPNAKKHLVIEGATRVTVLRELCRKHAGQDEAERFRFVTAKVLPEDFSEKEIAILLARIHVRGSGVRAWGRYVEAQFVYRQIVGENGKKPLMTAAELARFLERSQSWVSRLRDAYEFALQYVEYFGDLEARMEMKKKFSILEEISKSTGFGPLVRDPANEQLRNDVFEMVRAGVFKEYRDARFMKEFHDDPEKWAALKSHEQDIAHKLAVEVKAGNSGLKGRINALYSQIERALEREPGSLGETELNELQQCVELLESHLADSSMFRLKLRAFTKAVMEASLSDLMDVTDDELDALDLGLEDIRYRRQKQQKVLAV